MIVLTKINGEQFLVNCDQIEVIESVPESKVVMMNEDYFLVKEGLQEIFDKIVQFKAEVSMRRLIAEQEKK